MSTTGLQCSTLSLVQIPRKTDVHLFHMANLMVHADSSLMVHADFGDSLPRGRGAQHHPP